MIQVTPISLSDCPGVLQAEVRNRLNEPDSEVLSVTVTESTPYKDKTNISRQYRVVMNRLNLVSVLHCYDDGVLRDKVSANQLIWGDILEIIRTAPDSSSLGELRKAIPEETKKRLSL